MKFGSLWYIAQGTAEIIGPVTLGVILKALRGDMGANDIRPAGDAATVLSRDCTLV